MTTQVAEYFNRFYTLVLKDLITDPLVHSEWLYFQSMFKNNTLEGDRIDLYLGILTNEHKKKRPPSVNTRVNSTSLTGSEDRSIAPLQPHNHASPALKPHPPKLEKKYSEHWRTQVSISDGKSFPTLPLRSTSSCRDRDSHTSSRSLKKAHTLQSQEELEEKPRASEPASGLSQQHSSSSVGKGRPNAKAYLHSIATYQIGRGITPTQHQQLKDISQNLLSVFRKRPPALRA